MTIAESLLPAIKEHQPGVDIIYNVLLDVGNIDCEGTSISGQVVSYMDGSMLTYDGDIEEWVASMWDASGDDLDDGIY